MRRDYLNEIRKIKQRQDELDSLKNSSIERLNLIKTLHSNNKNQEILQVPTKKDSPSRNNEDLQFQLKQQLDQNITSGIKNSRNSRFGNMENERAINKKHLKIKLVPKKLFNRSLNFNSIDLDSIESNDYGTQYNTQWQHDLTSQTLNIDKSSK